MREELQGELPAVVPAAVPVLQSAEADLALEALDEPSSLTRAIYVVVALLGFAAYVGLYFAGESAQRFALAGLESLPFLILAVLAYTGERYRELRIVTFLYWTALMALVAAGVMLFSFLAVAQPGPFANLLFDFKEGHDPTRADLDNLISPEGRRQLVRVLLWLLPAGLLGLVAFTRRGRRTAAGLLPVYADSHVHAVAVATVLATTAFLFVPLNVLGQPPLLEMFNHFEGTSLAEDFSSDEQIADTLAAFVWLVPATVLAVGFPFTRTIPDSLRRIGLVKPTNGQVVFGVCAAGALVVVMTGVDSAIGYVWRWIGWPTTDATTFDKLMKSLVNPVGAVIIGVTAGLGEELFARGVLQPRVGIFLSNMLFTAMHALQYHWDALLSVFLIGLVLGVIRQKSNTTTSAIVHGVYDFILIMWAWYETAPH